MARKSTQTLEETAREAAGETAEEVEPSLSLFDASGDSRVRVLRRDDKTQKWIPHGYFPADATEETILKEFGGGRYWVQLLSQVDGKEGIRNHRKFELVGPYRQPRGDLPGIRDTNEQAPAAAATVGTLPTGGSGNDLMSVLNATVLSTFIDLLKTMKEANTKPAPTLDPMMVELMRAQAATQQKIIEMVITLGAKDGGDSKKEILAMMAQMKDILTPQIPPTASGNPMDMFNSMLEAFSRMRETAEDMTPRGNGGSGDPLLDSIPKLAEVIAERHQMEKIARQHTPTPPLQITPPPSPPQNGQPTTDMPIWQQVLHAQSKRLVESAASGRKAEIVAGAAVEFAPPVIRGALTEFFRRDAEEVTAQIISEVPQLAQYPQWTGEFVEHVQFILFPDEFGGDDEETPEEVEETK